LSLGGWIGSWAFFAFVVSRVAFQVLPGDVAGDLAGMLLEVLHFGGAGLALIAAAAAAALGRRGWLVGLPICLAILCIASEVLLSPEIAAVRPSTLGAAATEESSRRFSRLHTLSLGLFLSIHLVSVLLLVLHARIDARLHETTRSRKEMRV
jgi:hypothetical protein